MKYTVEKNLSDFNFWGPAKWRAAKLTPEELNRIEYELETNGIIAGLYDEMALNDLFAYGFDTVCQLIGLTEEEVIAR